MNQYKIIKTNLNGFGAPKYFAVANVATGAIVSMHYETYNCAAAAMDDMYINAARASSSLLIARQYEAIRSNTLTWH